MSERVVVIGYGNLLRQDDGIGQILADAVGARFPEVEAITRTQLTPELAEPLSRAAHAFFIDASVELPPGHIVRRPVMPSAEPGTFTHDTTPAALLASSRSLYGSAPPATLIAVGGAVFGCGSELSPRLETALTRLITTVCEWIAESLNRDRPSA